LLQLKNGKKVLLDCGMFQGMGKETDQLNTEFGFEPTEVDAVVLSHAHIDHSGLLPLLVKEGFLKSIYCTPATKELAAILMLDSAGIQENDLKYQNRRRKQEGKPLLEALYSEKDANAAAALLEARQYNEWFPVVDGLECMFTDAGHIIGSACVHLRVQEDGKTIHFTFSGDIGRYRDAILRSPDTFPQADFIVMESTYGNSLHEDVFSTVDTLLKWIVETCLHKKGKLIIPAFSVGRTQELLYFLNQLELEKRLPPLDYFVDSPLSYEATQIVKNHPENYNERVKKVLLSDEDPFQFKGMHFIRSADESKQLNFRREPCVIISASGMAEAGRVKHHISNNIENSHNTILIVGYCEPNSLGGRLRQHPKEVSIYGVVHEVHAQIGEMRSMSAHGDYEDMCQWLACQQADLVQKLFLVHGEYDVQQQFAERLRRKGFRDVEIPERHSQFTLSL
jgi:metallo-beta-lactamase family protein